MLNRFLTCLFLLVAFSVSAQEKKSDLLEKLKTAKEDTAKISLLNNLARAYTGVNNDSALYYSQEGVALAKRLNNSLYEGRSRNVLAGVYITTGKFDLALAELKLVKKAGEEENDPQLVGNAYHNMGNVYRAGQDVDSALILYKLALGIREQLHDSSGIASSLGGVGVCYYLQGDLKTALDYYYRVVPVREAMHDKKGLASVYYNIALIHVDRKDKGAALETLSKAYDLYTEIGNTQSVAIVANTIGVVYSDDQQYDKAREWYFTSMEMRAQIGDSAGIAESYTNIGNVFALQNNYDSALVWYRKTLGFLHLVDVGHQVSILSNYGLGAAHAGKIDSAMWAMDQVRALVVNEKRPDLFVSLYGSLGEVFEKSGKLDSALYYTRLYHALSDSLYRDESQKILGEMETKYQTAKKEKAIDDLTAVQKQKDLQLLAACVGIGCLLILVGFVIYGSIQRKKTNRLLALQNAEISVKNKDITDSINYARRIQQSVLPDEHVLFDNVSEAFLLYKPRDIVSGDFYWFRKEGTRLYVACADCTGHGVPGALVSVVGVNILEQILEANKKINTGELLNQLHRMLIQALNKDTNVRDSKDGMDIAVMCIDAAANTIEFSGASRPLYRFDGTTLVQIKGDRFSIGGAKDFDDTTSFSTVTLPLIKGEAFYMFSDGYADQFGGPQNKKFMSRQFFDLVATHAAEAMAAQESRLENSFLNWQGKNEQVDDVLVIGIRV